MKPRIESDELIYDGRAIEVHKMSLRMPDGKVVSRDFIHYAGAAVILPVLDDGSIVLIRNYRFAAGEDLYELPAGNIDAGEDPLTCAARELTEETGYVASHIEKIGEFFSAPGTTDEKLHAYLATGLQMHAQELEDYEQIVVETASASRVREMVLDGTIHDAKTIATLGLYWLARGE